MVEAAGSRGILVCDASSATRSEVIFGAIHSQKGSTVAVFSSGVLHGREMGWPVVGALMEHGKPADTPVAIVQWCSRARQQTVKSALETVVDIISKRAFGPHPSSSSERSSITHPRYPGSRNGPSFEPAFVVAGSKRTSSKLRHRFNLQGAEVLTQPAIRVAPPWIGPNRRGSRTTR